MHSAESAESLQIVSPNMDVLCEQAPLPRLGFVGTGWIGRLRLAALLPSQKAQCCMVHDPTPEAAKAAADLHSGLRIGESFDELLQSDLDGLVIATPSALHAKQCLLALTHGKAVFCQKPLARTRDETAQVVAAARAANKLLAVDFCYRHLKGVDQLRQMISAGELGEIFAADLVFHNAYGPDKAWFYDVKSAGGGCVMDLGIHLVDLAMWMLNQQEPRNIRSRLYRHGSLLSPNAQEVEDFANAEFELGGSHVRLSCSWNLNAGRDAVIEANFYGTKGGAAIRNVNGSFFDFEVLRFQGTQQQTIASYPDDWGCRALTQWVEQLQRSAEFDESLSQAVTVADVIDTIYGR